MNISNLTKNIYKTMYPACEKNHRVSLYLGKNIEINADEALIVRVISNLLSNAHKYTPDNGEIEVTLRTTEKFFEFKIQDTGIGIAKKDHKNIFKLFSLADTGFARIDNRLGVGLHIVKKIVELHNGKVWFESEEGKGSTFYFTLPK